MATKKPTTKKPSGLSLSRSSNTFTCSWKRAENYGYQQFQYYVKNKWVSVTVTKSQTSCKISLSNATLSGVTAIKFRVRGRVANYTKKGKKYAPKWSAYTTYTAKLAVPATPVLSSTTATDVNNQSTFSWTVSTTKTDLKPFINTEYQSILSDSPEQPSDIEFAETSNGWIAGTATEKHDLEITETDTTALANGSCTRWVRVRSVGTVGGSEWAYINHVYAQAGRATVNGGSARKTDERTTAIICDWATDITKANPVDSTVVRYAIAIPTADMDCPDDATWKDGFTYSGASENDAASFSITEVVGENQCLFVRVDTKHDNVFTYGVPKLILSGALSNPTFSTLEVDTDTNKVTITATNNSDVPSSYLQVFYRDNNGNETYIGDIESGETTATLSFIPTSTVYAFAIKAVAGNMTSSTVVKGGEIPTAPDNVRATVLPNGSIRVQWGWTWTAASFAQIGWAENSDAWESTDEPSTYTISSLHASAWNLAGLATGLTWYIRVRLASGTTQNATYSPWSDMIAVNLTEAPTTPSLTLSSNVVTKGGTVTASWAYSSGDGTTQAYAEICEAEISSNGITYGDIIAHTDTAQSVVIPSEIWETGTMHYLCVRVTSASGITSDGWSNAVALYVADEITAEIVDTNITVGEEVNTLTSLPLTVITSGAGDGGTTTAIIERASDYHLIKPDETEHDGFEGETIALVTAVGDGTITINRDDLIGTLDDGGQYRLIVNVKDNYGQTDEKSVLFTASYSEQPTAPTATVEVDNGAVKITPQGNGTVDIYRLSVDRPQLIVSGGTFGETYVDPFPTLGEYGGHRIVARNENGDYIQADSTPAWIDLTDDDGDIIDTQAIIISFNGGMVELPYNITLSNSWSKDFSETKYLGGSVTGDWNSNINRTLTANSAFFRTADSDLIEAMRRLAVHPGICHVRTPEGSSFTANVNVNEEQAYNTKLVEYSLTISRVETQELDGMTLAEWTAYNEME